MSAIRDRIFLNADGHVFLSISFDSLNFEGEWIFYVTTLRGL